MTKDKFKGILLASDLDGTLLYENKVPQKNAEAIKYFEENGGLFTVATGRTHQTICDFYSILNANAPLVMCNGMQLYDYKKNIYLFEKFLEPSAFLLFEHIVKMFPDDKFSISSKGTVYDFSQNANGCLPLEKAYPLVDKMNKFVHIAETLEAVTAIDNAAKAFILEKQLLNIGTMYSWPTHLEFASITINKGSSLLMLADFLNVSVENVYAIGDYMNDIPMLKAVKNSFAPENSAHEVLAEAKYKVCDCKYGAVAEAIDIIEKML